MHTIHQTDLFRPHADPDDHFDLASQFAIALTGRIELSLVLIDHPPVQEFLDDWDFLDSSSNPEPDISAVARMNRRNGMTVPIAVGSAIALDSSEQSIAHAHRSQRQGVEAILRIVRESVDGVVIHICGSCRDVAYAIAEDPQAFAKNCRGIYLNAGLGSPTVNQDAPVEYNVALNHLAFKTVLKAPCPVFWMPCYESFDAEFGVREFSTWFDFDHAEVLPQLDNELAAYFEDMFARRTTSSWMQTDRPLDAAMLNGRRNMWCTPGFFHAAGLAVSIEGQIIPQPDNDTTTSKSPHETPVFELVPATVECDAQGRTSWRPGWADPQHQVWIHRVTDVNAYRSAMARALTSLLRGDLK